MPRRLRILATLTTLTASLLTASTVGAGLATAAEPARGGLDLYGVNVHTLWSGTSAADVTRELDLLRDLGANTARVDVSWSSLQTDGRGTINADYQKRVDTLIDGAAGRGIAPVVVLHTTPCWASTAPETLKQGCQGAYWDRGVTRYPPVDNADFAWAASWVAQRYGSRLAALELWNEPNYTEGFTNLTTADKPAVYAAMVKAAYPAVKAVAPRLPVLMGALSFADAPFLAALYRHGVRGSYDGVSVHPYNESRAPGAPHDPAWAKYDYALGLQSVRATMTAASDSSPVWVTEMGWTDCTLGADPWCVTPAQQAAYSAAVVQLTAQRFPWVKALILYNLRDKGTDRSYTEDNFGLVTRDYTPKPALAAVRAAFAGLRGAPAAPAAVAAAVATAPAPAAPKVAAPVVPAPAAPVTTAPSAPVRAAAPATTPAPNLAAPTARSTARTLGRPSRRTPPRRFIGPRTDALTLVGPAVPAST